jgi:hypothetical protein
VTLESFESTVAATNLIGKFWLTYYRSDRVNEALSNENEALRQQLGEGQHGDYDQPSEYTNANGKRPMVNHE